MITVDIKPMSAIRMTQRGKWVNTSAIRYLNYKRDVGYQLKEQCLKPLEGAVRLDITFYMQIPESWSEKRKKAHLGLPVTSKNGDVDNLCKGLMDAANGILYTDDCQVTDVTMRKRYAYQGSIELTITPVEVGA